MHGHRALSQHDDLEGSPCEAHCHGDEDEQSENNFGSGITFHKLPKTKDRHLDETKKDLH